MKNFEGLFEKGKILEIKNNSDLSIKMSSTSKDNLGFSNKEYEESLNKEEIPNLNLNEEKEIKMDANDLKIDLHYNIEDLKRISNHPTF